MERIMTPRRYIRHPTDVPVEVEPEHAPSETQHTLSNIGFGGVAFNSRTPWTAGSRVRVRIASVRPPFEAQARVAWCQRNETHYLIGVRFVSRDDFYAARMVEQLCHIEHYRHEVMRTQGRALTSQQAAMEWISKYADEFPTIDS